MNGLAKYLISIISEATLADAMDDRHGCGDAHNLEDITVIVEKKLQELLNSELDIVLSIIEDQKKEYGDLARCTKYTCSDIEKKIRERIIQ